jgi:serine phosphatase RsbU (regulator of sigma subunit)
MKFRWKLLILLLVISIIPVVSLRTFGIHNVRLMAEALISRIKTKQRESARTITLSILEAVEEHRGKGEQEDDSTVVVVKVVDG